MGAKLRKPSKTAKCRRQYEGYHKVWMYSKHSLKGHLRTLRLYNMYHGILSVTFLNFNDPNIFSKYINVSANFQSSVMNTLSSELILISGHAKVSTDVLSMEGKLIERQVRDFAQLSQ